MPYVLRARSHTPFPVKLSKSGCSVDHKVGAKGECGSECWTGKGTARDKGLGREVISRVMSGGSRGGRGVR